MAEYHGARDYHTVTPYLVVRDAGEVIRFLTEAFGARERFRLKRTNGSIMHAEVSIGDSIVMIGEAPQGFDPAPTHLYLKVADADAAYRRALEAGGESFMEPMDMKHAGQRYGGVKDPAGNVWYPAVELEVVPIEEEQRRIHEMGL